MFRLSFIEASLRFGRKTIITNAVYQFVQKRLRRGGVGGSYLLEAERASAHEIELCRARVFLPGKGS